MDQNSTDDNISATYSVLHLPNWQTDYIQNIKCDLQYEDNPKRHDNTKNNFPWYIPINYFRKPPQTINRFMLNKLIYVIDPEVRSVEFFYDLLKLGLRMFLIQLKSASQYRWFKIVRMLKCAANKYKDELDPHIEISIGYEILGRYCRVGRLSNNDQPICVEPNRRVNNTSSTRDKTTFELKSNVFPLILDKHAWAQEHDDAKFVKHLHGDFVITSDVDDIRYYGILAELFSDIDIPIIGHCDLSIIHQDAIKLAKLAFDGFMIGATDNINNDLINASIRENKPIVVHINYLKTLRKKTQNEQFISKVVNEIDCIIIDNVSDITNILSIQAIDISDYDRSSFMHCELNKHLRAGEFMLGTTAITSHILHANLIFCTTKCGKTVKLLVKHRPNCAIFAITTSSKTARRLMFYRGVLGLVWKRTGNWIEENEKILEFCLDYAKKYNIIKENQTVLYIYSSDILTDFPNIFRIIKT